MDVSFGVFSPAPVLSFNDDLCDGSFDEISDDGIEPLDFSPMDICMSDGQDYINECIDSVQLSLPDIDTTLVDTKMDTLEPCSNESELEITVSKSKHQSETETSATTVNSITKQTGRKSKAKINLCPICGVDLKRSKKCKQCSNSTKVLHYDSGIASGDDVNAASTDKIDDVTSDVSAAPRRSGRRRSTVDKQYELRTSSLVNRVQVERRQTQPKQPKPKTKPPPLSKYRRKTANARERTRMNEINDGFEELKDVIPNLPNGKLTKITTLRLALNYISALRRMLGYKDDYALTPSDDLCSSSSSPSDDLTASSPTGSDSSGAEASASDANNSETGSNYGGTERILSIRCDSSSSYGSNEGMPSSSFETGNSHEGNYKSPSNDTKSKEKIERNDGSISNNCGSVGVYTSDISSPMLFSSAESPVQMLPSFSQLFSSHSLSTPSS